MITVAEAEGIFTPFTRSVADMDCPARAALYDVFIKAMELLDIKMTDKETKKL